MLNNIHRNIMGTISFDAKFEGMRKPQDFIVYPMQAGDDATRIKVQSDTRYGIISLADGKVFMSPAVANGANAAHLAQGKHLAPISAEELLLLKSHIMASASGKAGTNGIVYCDNSKALEVFAEVGDAAAAAA